MNLQSHYHPHKQTCVYVQSYQYYYVAYFCVCVGGGITVFLCVLCPSVWGVQTDRSPLSITSAREFTNG